MAILIRHTIELLFRGDGRLSPAFMETRERSLMIQRARSSSPPILVLRLPPRTHILT